MARFRLSNVQIKTVTKEGSNKGRKYMIADLINLQCPFEGAQKYSSFLESIVNILEPLLPVSKGGTAQTEQPLPAELAEINGCFAEFTPAQKFYKTHLSDHPELGIKAGDIVKKDGKPIIYEKLIVFCQYYTDEYGQKAWMKGASPDEAGQRAFSNYCVPIDVEPQATTVPFTPPSAPVVDAPPTGGMPVAPDGFEYREVNGSLVLMPKA